MIRPIVQIASMMAFLAIAAPCAEAVERSEPKKSGGSGSASVALQGFFFSHKAEQGDATLVDGSTIYTRLVGMHRFTSLGLGVGGFLSRDLVGESQTDSSVGLRLEGEYAGFYAAAMFGSAQQTYQGRSVGERTGSAAAFALGLRGQLVFPKVFFDFSIERRTTTFSREDGRTLRRDIIDEQLLPLLGAGLYL